MQLLGYYIWKCYYSDFGNLLSIFFIFIHYSQNNIMVTIRSAAIKILNYYTHYHFWVKMFVNNDVSTTKVGDGGGLQLL